ncbi:MAG TPA: hypothetical protein VGH87_25540 [Polyangiaceae bacterium]
MKRVALAVVIACGGQQQAEPQPVTIPTATATATETASPPTLPIATTAPSESTQAAPSHVTAIVDRDVWIAQFEMALPVALCRDNFYFRSCFTVTADECERTAASATRVCLAKFKKQLPEKFHQPDEGTEWGSKIGNCVGTAYEVALPSHRISNAKCNDPSQWTTPP